MVGRPQDSNMTPARPSPPASPELEGHGAWTLAFWRAPKTWSPALLEEGPTLCVLGLGLVGEAVESLDVVSEAIEADGPLDGARLREELGDTLYYWCVACARCGIPPERAWPASVDFEKPAPAAGSPAQIERAAILLARRARVCSESVKKMLRDGLDASALGASLPPMGAALALAARAAGFSGLDLARSNRDKLSPARRGRA